MNTVQEDSRTRVSKSRFCIFRFCTRPYIELSKLSSRALKQKLYLEEDETDVIFCGAILGCLYHMIYIR